MARSLCETQPQRIMEQNDVVVLILLGLLDWKFALIETNSLLAHLTEEFGHCITEELRR